MEEVAELSSSKRIHVSDYVPKGIPFYRGSEVSSGGISKDSELFISDNLYKEIKDNYGVPSAGDLLITAVGTLGNIWKVDNRQFYYKDGNLILLSNLKLDADFLVAYLTEGQGKKKILDSAAGSSQKALTMIKLNEIELFNPEFSEQTAIGNFFRILENALILHKRKHEMLKKLKKGYLQQMFPQKGECVPKVRFKGFTGDWEERKLGDVVSVNSGKDYKHLVIGDIPVYGTGGYMLSVNDKLSDKDAIGIGRKGTIDKPQLLKAPFWTVDTLFYAIPKTENDLYFMFSMFELINWKSFDESTGVPSLSKSTIVDINRMFPPLCEQTAIGNFFRNLDEQITAQKFKLDKLKLLKTAYLQKMFV